MSSMDYARSGQHARLLNNRSWLDIAVLGTMAAGVICIASMFIGKTFKSPEGGSDEKEESHLIGMVTKVSRMRAPSGDTMAAFEIFPIGGCYTVECIAYPKLFEKCEHALAEKPSSLVSISGVLRDTIDGDERIICSEIIPLELVELPQQA